MKAIAAIFCLLSVSAVLAQTPPATDTPLTSEPTTATASTEKAQESDATNTQSRARSPNRADRLDLDTTIVTGNRELPKVLYIVPWKKAEIGDLPAQPFNTLLDEVLSPVDREVFKREVSYFHTVTKNDAAAPNSSASKPATEGSR